MTYDVTCPSCENIFEVDYEALDGNDVICLCGFNLDVDTLDGDEYSEHDGDPGEAQEWHDFDPDC